MNGEQPRITSDMIFQVPSSLNTTWREHGS